VHGFFVRTIKNKTKELIETRMHKCLAGCGQVITWQFAICAKCERTYGRSARNWPEWLRFLWNDTQRNRRRIRRIKRHEVSLEAMSDHDLGYYTHDE
jgi:hypothetical protein